MCVCVYMCIHTNIDSHIHTHIYIFPSLDFVSSVSALMESMMKEEHKILDLEPSLLINAFPFKQSDSFFFQRKTIRLIAHLLPALSSVSPVSLPRE